MKHKTIKIFLIIFLLSINALNQFEISIKADSNTPQYKGNGWYNTTSGSNWIINTTGNIWENKNISISNSIELNNGGSVIFQNCSILINENLTIHYNSSLTLINSTIKFNSTTNGSSHFSVKSGGSLYIFDYDNNSNTLDDSSIISTNITDNKHRFVFIVSKKTNFTMRNSKIHQCGYSPAPIYYGPYIKSDNSIIENNIYSNNYAGLIIDSSNNSIKNNTFLNNDEYGFLIILGRNNTLNNNTLTNNKFNFGLLLDDLNQSNNITLDNLIKNGSICYLERLMNLTIDTNYTNANFLGIINSSNISVLNQRLNNNFNSMILLGVNNSRIENTDISDNYYGIFSNTASNIIFKNCYISNNSNVGLELVNKCNSFKIINCTLKNNFLGIRISNSNVTFINSSILNSSNNDMFLQLDSTIYSINCSFNKSKIKFGIGNPVFIVKYFLNIHTKNHTDVPIGNVSLEIYDGNNKLIRKGKSDVEGFLNWTSCESYEMRKAGINSKMSNHKLVAKYAGIDFVKYINISNFTNIIIYLNHPPMITNLPNKIVYIDEDSPFYYDFNSYDTDNDNLYWSYQTNASWFDGINEYTGLINSTPTDPDVGTFYLNISCNDSYSGIDYYNYTIIVNNTNDNPKIITTNGSGIAFEDKFYIHDFNVSDPDVGDNHNWSMVTDAQWLYPIHKLHGRVFGYPHQNHVGEYYVNISCTDREGAMSSYNYSLTVFPINDRPIIINPPEGVVIVKEDSMFYYNFEYSDQDKDKVTWSCNTNAKWLNMINKTTGELEGTPHDYDVGKFYINVSCKDPEDLSSFHNFTIKVQNTNDPPKFLDGVPETLFIWEDQYFEYYIKIDDPDKKDNFKFSISIERLNLLSLIRSSDETWLKLSSNSETRICTIYGIPTNDEVGQILVNITVKDAAGKSDSINFVINVNNTNDHPLIINRVPNLVYIIEDIEYYYDFNYQDIDGDSVIWSLNTNAKWITGIIESTGEVSGIPRQEDLGTRYFLKVKCTDQSGGFDSQNFTIQINNTNDPPIIINPCSKIVYIDENDLYQYDFDSIDKDSKNVYWSSNSNADWLESINPYTGIITGTPLDKDVGEYSVQITCRDDLNNYTYWNYTIIVNNLNDPPRIRNGYAAPITINLNEKYFFKFKSTDPDDDQITWKFETNGSSWLSFDSNTGILSGIPSRFDFGSYYVNISCYDQYNGFDFYFYNIKVKGIYNHPPVLSKGHIDPEIGDNSTLFTFYVTYSDFDYDEPYSVYIKIDNQPHIMIRYQGSNISDGIVYRYETKLETGNHTYYFMATDSLYGKQIINDYTPGFQNPNNITVHERLEKAEQKESSNQLYFIMILVFIFIIILIILGIIYKKKSQHEQDISFEVEPEPEREKKPVIDQKQEFAPAEIEPIDEMEEDEGKDKPKSKKERKSLTQKKPRIGKKPIIKKEKKKIESEHRPEIEKLEEVVPEEEVDSKVGRDILICPECGEFVNETFEECPGCGVKFIFDYPEQDKEIDHDILVCPECGEFVNETYSSCPSCGVKFIFEEEENTEVKEIEKMNDKNINDNN